MVTVMKPVGYSIKETGAIALLQPWGAAAQRNQWAAGLTVS